MKHLLIRRPDRSAKYVDRLRRPKDTTYLEASDIKTEALLLLPTLERSYNLAHSFRATLLGDNDMPTVAATRNTNVTFIVLGISYTLDALSKLTAWCGLAHLVLLY